MLDRAVLYLSTRIQRRRRRSACFAVYSASAIIDFPCFWFVVDFALGLYVDCIVGAFWSPPDIATFYYHSCHEYRVVPCSGGRSQLESVTRGRLSNGDSEVKLKLYHTCMRTINPRLLTGGLSSRTVKFRILYVDADYPGKATGRRSVSSGGVMRAGVYLLFSSWTQRLRARV